MQREESYNYKNCSSLFGYAKKIHENSRFTCMLCDCGGEPVDFDLWRQMTVEHLIGRSQRGGRKDIESAVDKRFNNLSAQERADLVEKINLRNKVTACSFCNSTTSRDNNQVTMADLIIKTPGEPDDVLKKITKELDSVLERKRRDVAWKIESVKIGFKKYVLNHKD